VNNPGGGKVETVFTAFTQRFPECSAFFLDVVFADVVMAADLGDTRR
jgi:hypothetical protein